MIRSTLDPAAPCAAVTITPLGDVAFTCRTVELGAAHPAVVIPRVAFPCRVRLARKGNVFTAEYSQNGVEWKFICGAAGNQPARVEIPMGETVHVGVTLASHDRSRPAETAMSDVAVEGKSGPPDPFDTFDHVGL
jgi:hypothetical protein